MEEIFKDTAKKVLTIARRFGILSKLSVTHDAAEKFL